MKACSKCPPGTISDRSRTGCTPCAEPGSYVMKGTCQPCPVGSYLKKKGDVSCTKCEAGKFADEEASTACKSCETGLE